MNRALGFCALCMAFVLALAACSPESPVASPPLNARVLCASCYGVAVTPDHATITRPANQTGLSEAFLVQNTGLVRTMFNLACSTTGGITCTGLTTTSVTLDPN